MGDILTSLFGSGQRTTQDTELDPYTTTLNQQKVDQIASLFGNRNLGSYYDSGGAYTQSQAATDITNAATSDYNRALSSDNIMSLSDYIAKGLDSTLFNTARESSAQNLADARSALSDETSIGRARNMYDYQTGLQSISDALNTALGQTGRDYENAYGVNQQNYGQAMSNLSSLFEDLYGKGLDTTSNYISQIATPQINQAMVLQGLEGSGAVGEAIAKATAGIGGDFLKDLIASYLPAYSSTQQQYMGEQSDLGKSRMAADLSSTGAYQTGVTGLSSDYQNNQAGLSNVGLQSLAKLLGDYNTAEQAAYEGQAARNTSFLSTIPSFQNAQTQGTIGRQQAASSLFNMTDQPRALQEAELNRRQQLGLTAFTGIPTQAATTTSQRTSSQPLFNFFGQG